MKLLCTLLLALSISCAYGQNLNRWNQWYFGFNAGLDFNSGTPVPILTGQIGTPEGSASIADKNTGQLLFYTDGVRVYNSNNAVMANSYPLGGYPSTTQAATIIQKPGSNTLFYVFTIDTQAGTYYNPGNGGLAVSVVDMALNGGLGGIALRDSIILTPTAEKCATTLACNGSDVWVVVHKWNSDAFYSYLVTDHGIMPPVISHAGIYMYGAQVGGENAEAIGYMHISHNGKKLALNSTYKQSLVQFCDFDNITGIVSNAFIDSNFVNVASPYGLCFSPDDSKLYVTSNGFSLPELLQYNMLAGSGAAIIASRTLLNPNTTNTTLGAIQQGPDGKLYVARSSDDTLGVITNPNALGLACNYIPNGQSLGGKNSSMGLPQIVNYDFIPKPDTGSVHPHVTTICAGQSVLLTATNGITYSWLPSLTLNTASGDSVTATPSATTTYIVTGTTPGGCVFTDSAVVIVTTVSTPATITLDEDTLTSSAAQTYQWVLNGNVIQNATAQTYIAPVTGYYQVITTTAGGCSATSDSVFVSVKTGIYLSAISNLITIYPNPFSNTFYLKINPAIANVTDWNLQVTDIAGRILYSRNALNYDNTIDLTGMANGTYFITLATATDRVVKRVVKQ